MIAPANYKNSFGMVLKAFRLTKQNVDVFTEWCYGRQVRTFDPTDPEDTEGQVGVNFPGKDHPERVSEGQFLVQIGNVAFKAMDPCEFHAEYELV